MDHRNSQYTNPESRVVTFNPRKWTESGYLWSSPKFAPVAGRLRHTSCPSKSERTTTSPAPDVVDVQETTPGAIRCVVMTPPANSAGKVAASIFHGQRVTSEAMTYRPFGLAVPAEVAAGSLAFRLGLNPP